MATIARGALTRESHEFFDALRSYDAAKACKVLADDAAFVSPWSGVVRGRANVEAFLASWLKDAVKRPSFTLRDVTGDGAVVHMVVSVSRRFGEAPQMLNLDMVSVQGKLHDVQFSDPSAASGHH
jgi:ketosteroid isomerase-like protein